MKVEKDYPVPTIADGQVLIKNQFSGINFIDTYHRSGLYKRDLPFIGGQEGGGTVAATTPKAEAMGLKVGDRVAYSLPCPRRGSSPSPTRSASTWPPRAWCRG